MSKKLTAVKTQISHPRPPIVTVLGHVDHGKTTLLDKIRQTKVAEKEAGRITQRIGAYQVEVEVGKEREKRKITFLDTPGHEAFTKMRERGAKITDLAILLVAADDGVMPQTKESIEYLRETQTPFLVALNKMDLPTANSERVKKQLADAGVLTEDLGGEIVCLPISAKTGQGIKELLEMIILLAEMAEVKANPQGPLKLAVVESRLDARRGPVATVIIKNGTLRQGDTIELGGSIHRVRGMFDEKGRQVSEAGPSGVVEILGFKSVPSVGEVSWGKTEKEEGEEKLKIILKADLSGSLEAIGHSLPPQIEVALQGTGEINESDVLLAKTNKANIFGFNLRVSPSVEKLAETEKVFLKTYNVIYELLEELQKMVLAKTTLSKGEEILGQAKIIAQFPFNKEKIAGCQISEGRLSRGDAIRLMRSEGEVGRAKIKTLKHFQEEIPKAEIGLECGVLLTPPLDFQLGDVLISYKTKS